MKTIVVYAIAFVALANGIHGQSNPEEKPQICTPGARSMEDCNTCTCSLDGTAWGCTRMACPKIPAEYLNPDGSIKLPHQNNPLLRTKRAALMCEPGTERTWECNKCRCSPDGTAELCTRQICPGSSRKRRDEVVCTPNENFMNDCNHCRCSPDGRSAACTLMGCGGIVKIHHQYNTLIPTRQDQVCAPNTTRVWECNNCRCNTDGTAEVCTRRVCPAVPRNRRDVPFRCEPNKSFMQDCNTCFCSPDGRSAGCTLMFCIPQNPEPSISQPKIAA